MRQMKKPDIRNKKLDNCTSVIVDKSWVGVTKIVPYSCDRINNREIILKLQFGMGGDASGWIDE